MGTSGVDRGTASRTEGLDVATIGKSIVIKGDLSGDEKLIIDGKVEEQQEKLVAKLNAKLDKNQENLRLSLSDAMRSKWVRQTSGYLPKPVQSALNQK